MTTLARCAAELEAVCAELDANDGEITDAMIARFDQATMAMTAKVDGWINYIESVKGMAGIAEARKVRATKRHETLVNLHKRLKARIKELMLLAPGIPFKGSEEQLYLHGHAEAPEYAVTFAKKALSNVVDQALLEMEPGLGDYCKSVTTWVIDGDKVRTALRAGVKLPWAKLNKGSDVRIKA